MLLAHKIALDPNATQREHFARASGSARFAWNWALGQWRREYALRREYGCGPQPSDVSLRRDLNAIKRERFPWMYDVSKCVVQEAIIDLGTAFRAFFEGRGAYPRFKPKDDRASFCASNEVGRFVVDGKRIRLPVIGWVKMREEVRFSGALKRATVSCEAGRWFVSLMINTNDVKPLAQPEAAVGVDLGVSALATLSTGEVIEGPKAHKAALARLRRANRVMARKRRGSKNAKKQKARLARLHRRVAAIRRDATHKLTTMLAKRFRVVGIENLNVRGMVKNRALARAVSDSGFYEFRRQVEYKAKMYGARVVVADRWFPSSKTCSCCGVVKPALALSERQFRCDDCGFEAGRDVNAALNLAAMAASSVVSACGEERSGAARKPRVKRTSAKQEPMAALREAA